MSPEIITVLVAIVVAMSGLAGYILKAKIGPIEKSAEEGNIRFTSLEATLISTLKTITDNNAAFRLEYTKDMGELKLLLIEKYADKSELEALKAKVAELEMDIELLKQQGGS